MLVDASGNFELKEVKKVDIIERINNFADNNYDEMEITNEESFYANCIDVFESMIPDNFIPDLVRESNNYARNGIEKASKIKLFSISNRWDDFKEDDIKKYLGLTLWMGMHSNSYYQSKIFYNCR